MPSVNLQPHTYEALERIAEASGLELEATLEQAVLQFIASAPMSEERYQREWDEVLNEIRAHVPPGITQDEVEADIDEATNEVWADRRANSR